MPEVNYKHIRVRDAKYFSEFKTISNISHLHPDDRKKVRNKIGRKKALFVVGKLKKKYKSKGNKGKRVNYLAWALQGIRLPKTAKGVSKYMAVRRKRAAKTAKVGTVRNWGGREYIKMRDGSWKYYSQAMKKRRQAYKKRKKARKKKKAA